MKPESLFVLAGMLFAAGCFFIWTAASAAPNAAPECEGVLSLFADDTRCRWPPVSHYGMKTSFVLMLFSLLIGLIIRRKQGS
jgi:hypothetical protein